LQIGAKSPITVRTLKHTRLNYSNLECSSICYQEVQFSETVVIQLPASLRILSINADNNQGLRKNATNEKRFKTQTESTSLAAEKDHNLCKNHKITQKKLSEIRTTKHCM
jgi:hypothetical protein